MNHWDARTVAGQYGRYTAFAAFCLLIVVLISLERGFPEPYAWFAAAAVAMAGYSLVSMAVYSYLIRQGLSGDGYPYADASVDVEPLPQESKPVAPEPYATAIKAAPNWLTRVDWDGVIQHSKQPALSRDSVGTWVDQRFYSPREGDNTVAFPDLMVQIGAARMVNVNDQKRYFWEDKAPVILANLKRQVTSNSPYPVAGSNGTVNNRQ